jgi:hypothetical protein
MGRAAAELAALRAAAERAAAAAAAAKAEAARRRRAAYDATVAAVVGGAPPAAPAPPPAGAAARTPAAAPSLSAPRGGAGAIPRGANGKYPPQYAAVLARFCAAARGVGRATPAYGAAVDAAAREVVALGAARGEALEYRAVRVQVRKRRADWRMETRQLAREAAAGGAGGARGGVLGRRVERRRRGGARV